MQVLGLLREIHGRGVWPGMVHGEDLGNVAQSWESVAWLSLCSIELIFSRFLLSVQLGHGLLEVVVEEC